MAQFLEEAHITAGSISGIGATDRVTLRYYDIEKKEYFSKEFTGEFEIVALTGNVSVMDGKPWAHLHIVVSDKDYRCFGGHLNAAVISVTCEVVIHAAAMTIERTMDDETGLKLWCLA